MCLRNDGIFNECCSRIFFNIVSTTMYVPVRPTPAEQWTTIGPPVSGLHADERRINERTGSVNNGTPWSGQSV